MDIFLVQVIVATLLLSFTILVPLGLPHIYRMVRLFFLAKKFNLKYKPNFHFLISESDYLEEWKEHILEGKIQGISLEIYEFFEERDLADELGIQPIQLEEDTHSITTINTIVVENGKETFRIGGQLSIGAIEKILIKIGKTNIID